MVVERACRVIFGEANGDTIHCVWEQVLKGACDGSDGGHCSLLDGVKDMLESHSGCDVAGHVVDNVLLMLATCVTALLS